MNKLPREIDKSNRPSTKLSTPTPVSCSTVISTFKNPPTSNPGAVCRPEANESHSSILPMIRPVKAINKVTSLPLFNIDPSSPSQGSLGNVRILSWNVAGTVMVHE